MDRYLPIITSFVSGIFGLIVAIVTWRLATGREKANLRQEQSFKAIKDLEQLYAECLALIEKIIIYTETGENYTTLYDNLTINNARIGIIGSEAVNEQLNVVKGKITEWSNLYKKGMPKKIGVSDFALFSSEDSKYKEAAQEVYPKLMDAIRELVRIIKSELILEKKMILK